MFSKKIAITFYVLLIAMSISNFAFANSIIPNNFSFQKNIKLGDTLLPDVRYLQNFLNQNPSTKVSDVGPGSDAELTNYYGPKTSDAVRRFQNLYAVEILEPAGLLTGTGFFGEFTRRKINSLLASIGIGTQTITTSVAKTQTSKAPNVTAVFSEESFEASTTTPNRPIISGLSPNLVYSDQDEINIFGYNFTSIDNVVYGSLGSIENLTSSNNTITIRLKDFSQFTNASKYYSGTTTQIYLKVANINGVSQELASVHYAFPNIGNFGSSFGGGAGGSGDKSESSNTNAMGMVDVGSIDKEIHGLSPQGAVIKLIGGEETFDTMCGYSPSGVIFGGGGGMSGGGGGGGGSGSGSGGAGGGATNIDNGGGKITNITYCTCSYGNLLTMTDVRGGTRDIFYRYGYSTNHENYNVFAAMNQNYIEGLTKETVQCEVYNGESCDTQGTADWVIDTPRGVGTSLTGSGTGQ